MIDLFGVWQSVATFNFGAAQDEATQLTFVDESMPKGKSFATWLQQVSGSTQPDQIQVNEPRYTCQAVDPAKGERWVYVDPMQSAPLGNERDQQEKKPPHCPRRLLF